MEKDFVAYSGMSNVGYRANVNEDYILFDDRSFGDDMILVSIADGSGSKESLFRPSAIASNQIQKYMARIYEKDKDLLLNNTRLFLEESVLSANDVLCGFKLGNEEGRINFATSMTCMTLTRDGVLTFAHAGNTRLYLVRDERTMQLTKDHTIGQKLVDNGTITNEEYYTAIERLQIYNELGMMADPYVYTAQIPLRKNDAVIMTTDGIHYNFRAEAFFDFLVSTKTIGEAAEKMINTALDLRRYQDNISVNIVWYLGKE